MSLASVAQSSSPGEIIHLFRLDTSAAGGPIFYFTPGQIGGAPIVFGEVEYTPFDIEFSGFETNGVGALPTPRMKVANSTRLLQSLINTYGDDLLGSPIQRVRTFRRFLDGEADADPTAYWGPDAFKIERKVDENPFFIEFELSSSLDQEGKMLPGRVVVRDTCLWRYRIWDEATESFNYTRAQCPYTGSTYYDVNDQEVENASEDVPSRKISCCKLRFGSNAALPFGGFPGVGRVRG